jgi:hypothetical protein
MATHIKLWQQHYNVEIPKKPYTLAGFEPMIFCFVGGRDDNCIYIPRRHGIEAYFWWVLVPMRKIMPRGGFFTGG